MKNRFVLVVGLLFLILIKVSAQPAEINYLGTLVASGPLNPIPLANDGPFPVGFNFTFYGNIYSQFWVSENGRIMFTDPASAYSTEALIPTAALPNNFIAPFWDNLTIDGTGNILYTTIGSSPNRKLIVQYKNMMFYSPATFMGTFSIILYETSNIIQIQYRQIVNNSSDIAHGLSAAIGIENSDGTIGVEHSFRSSTAITSEQAISFTPGTPYAKNSTTAVYDGVYLVSNETLPEPGITTLLSPPQESTIGADHTFQWGSSSNASSYSLLISTEPDLGGAVPINMGSNLSYDTTGLTLDTTYYWGVFATNATGTTWCTIKKFYTSSAPPLAPVPQTIWTEQGVDKTIKLNYTGGDASAKTAIITTLPAQGQLYQYNAGARGDQITAAETTLTDANMNVIYAATGTSGNGAGNFKFKINDSGGDSPEGQITVNVSPPGVPNVLYVAKGQYIEIQFDIAMSDPSGKQDQFTVNVNSSPVTISSASLKTGDVNTIILTLATPLTGTENVSVAYTQGNVTGTSGGYLFSFTDTPVTLLAQTINFSQTLNKKFSDSPFTITATASSGLSLTYNSASTSVATFTTNKLYFHALGTSVITLRQLGNATYAPARYVKTLTVAKGDQTITFAVLPGKTYGNTDFTLSATATSGLSVSFSGDNNDVATVTGTTVHIVGAGSVVITASQSGNTLWNGATPVPRTLIVSKAAQTITFDALPLKVSGDADFDPMASSNSGLTVSYSSDNTDVATIVGGMIHIVTGGTANITASQSGNINYNAASDVIQPLTINKQDQTISFNALPAKTYEDTDFDISASATSGLSVSFASDNTDVATVTGNSVHIVGAGSAAITASQPGNTSWNAATPVPQTLTVSKASQTITFDALPDKITSDADFDPMASSSSGLTISYSSDNTDVATIVGGMIHIVAAGITDITASQAGDTNYDAAIDVIQPFTVNVITDLENHGLSSDRFIIYASSGYINIQTLSDDWDGKNGSVKILDFTGKTVTHLNHVGFSKNSPVMIEASKYAGMYIIVLKTGMSHYSEKIIIR